MVRKKEQERLRELLTEAVTVLCRGSLVYRQDFSIEGLLGITLDNEEIFLVNINEHVKKDDQADQTPVTHPIEQTSPPHTTPHKGQHHIISPSHSPQHSSARKNTPSGCTSRSSPSAKRRRLSHDRVTVKEENSSENHLYGRTTGGLSDRIENPVITLTNFTPPSSDTATHAPHPVALHQAPSVKNEGDLRTSHGSSPSGGCEGNSGAGERDVHATRGTRATDYSSLPGCSSWQPAPQEDSSSTSTHDFDGGGGISSSSTGAIATTSVAIKSEAGKDAEDEDEKEGTGLAISSPVRNYFDPVPVSAASPMLPLCQPSPVLSSSSYKDMPPKPRRCYDMKFKIMVLDWRNEHQANNRATSRKFGIDRKLVQEWRKNEDKLRLCQFGSSSLKKRLLGGGRKALSKDLDLEVLAYLQTEWAAGRVVRNADLKEKAKAVAIHIEGLENFTASDSWLRNWKRRHSVDLRHNSDEAEKPLTDLAVSVRGLKCVIEGLRSTHQYLPANIGCMSHMTYRFSLEPRSQNDPLAWSGIDLPVGGADKRKFTVALCAAASGEKKPAFVVFEEPSGVIPTDILESLQIPANIAITASHNGQMTDEAMSEWIQQMWGPVREEERRQLLLNRTVVRAMLAAGEMLESTDYSTDVVFLPPECASLLNPVDVVWNIFFEQELKKQWREYGYQDDASSQAADVNSATRQDVLMWVSSAWGAVPEHIIERSFKSCAITSNFDGSDDHLIHDSLADALNTDLGGSRATRHVMPVAPVTADAELDEADYMFSPSHSPANSSDSDT